MLIHWKIGVGKIALEVLCWLFCLSLSDQVSHGICGAQGEGFLPEAGILLCLVVRLHG